ncbi:hypothetical protein HK098_000981 [Nowakowskiella sp. JEL0407]|nr:hypothetical protein HK098_000981 [Nowakowskiella sp. JEL0407]
MAVETPHVDFFALSIAILSALILFFPSYYYLKRREWLARAGYPQAHGFLPIIGAPIEFGIDALSFVQKKKKELGDVFLVDLLAIRFHFCLGPKYVGTFYKQPTNELDFLAGAEDVMPEFIGPHRANGAMYEVHPLILKAFSQKDRLDKAYDLVVEECDKAFARWEKMDHFDIYDECSTLVIAATLRFIIGDETNEKYGFELAEIIAQMEKDVVHPLTMSLRGRLPFGPYHNMINARNKISDRISSVCEERLKSDRLRDLSILQFVIDEVGHKYPLETFSYFAVGIMMAARTNTAGVMAWTLAHFASDEKLQQQVVDEMAQNSCLDDTTFSTHEKKYPIEKLNFLDSCMKETVRMYSNFLQFRRVMLKDGYEVAPGKVVPYGELLCISPAEIHHDPQYFEDPWVYKPERWLEPDYFASRNRDTIFTMWGFLRHRCYGEKFANLFDKVMWVRLLSKYEISLADNEKKTAPPRPDWKPFGTSFPREGDHFYVKISKRK